MSIHDASRAVLAAAVRAPHASRCHPSMNHLRHGVPQLAGGLLSLRRATAAFRVGPSRDGVAADLEQSARPPLALAAISPSQFSSAVRPLFSFSTRDCLISVVFQSFFSASCFDICKIF
jgi:hypothetical protein